MCQSREFIEWYAVVATIFHLFHMIFLTWQSPRCFGICVRLQTNKDEDARPNVAGIMLYEALAFLQLSMAAYLFMAMYKFSKTMLYHYLTALKVWPLPSVAVGTLNVILLKTLHHDLLNLTDFELVILSVDEEVRENIAAFAVSVYVICDLCYTVFLHWRLRLFYDTMQDDFDVASPAPQHRFSPSAQYGVTPHPDAQLQHNFSPQYAVSPQYQNQYQQVPPA